MGYEDICVNDVPDFPITRNLWKALRNLRMPSTPLRLWVDQICINQQDKQEKMPQIRMMRSIFQKAQRVLLWLGEMDPALESSINKWMESEVRHHPWSLDPRALAQVKEAKAMNHKVASAVTAWDDHVGPWWTRAWVVEEYLLARKPFAVVGRRTLPLDGLILSIARLGPSFFLEMFPFFEDGKTVDYISHLFAMYELRHGKQEHSLFFFNCVMGFTETLKSHDKVYCILASLPEQEQRLITRDYDASESLVFAQATYADIVISHNLAILALVSRGASIPDDFPSWAVDFTFRQKRSTSQGAMWGAAFPRDLSKPMNRRSSEFMQKVQNMSPVGLGFGMMELFDHTDWKGWCRQHPRATASVSMDPFCRRLTVVGLEFDVVSSKCDVKVDFDWTFGSHAHHLISLHDRTTKGSVANRALSWIDRKLPSPAERSVLETIKDSSLAYARVGASPSVPKSPRPIAVDHVKNSEILPLFKAWDRQARPQNARPFQVDSNNMANKATGNETPPSTASGFVGWLNGLRHTSNLNLFLFGYLPERFGEPALFVTQAGFVGAGPHDMQEGDHIVLPYGCRSPMMLRPNRNGTWRFMGLVYVRGIMDDELMDCFQEKRFEEEGYVLV